MCKAAKAEVVLVTSSNQRGSMKHKRSEEVAMNFKKQVGSMA